MIIANIQKCLFGLWILKKKACPQVHIADTWICSALFSSTEFSKSKNKSGKKKQTLPMDQVISKGRVMDKIKHLTSKPLSLGSKHCPVFSTTAPKHFCPQPGRGMQYQSHKSRRTEGWSNGQQSRRSNTAVHNPGCGHGVGFLFIYFQMRMCLTIIVLLQSLCRIQSSWCCHWNLAWFSKRLSSHSNTETHIKDWHQGVKHSPKQKPKLPKPLLFEFRWN